MDILITATLFFIILSVLVIAHEAGHFFAAKRAGIKVEEFGFGLPPKLWGKQVGETEFTLNLLPIGGFVRLYGESPDGVSVRDNTPNPQDSSRMFMAKSKPARAGVLLAGVASNVVLGILIFTVVYTIGLPSFAAKAKIDRVEANSPAAQSGLKVGDTIIAANGQSVSVTEFSQLVQTHKGQPISLTIKDKSGRERQLTLTPRTQIPSGQGPLGVTLTNGSIYVESTQRYPIWQAWWIGIKEAFGFAGAILASLGGMVGGLLVKHTVPTDLAGPIGIAAIIGQARALGLVPVLWFTAIISVNLAVVNVLPFPALDGGRLLFVIIEAVTRRPVNPDLERKIHTVGMAILLTLIVLITFSDISHLLH